MRSATMIWRWSVSWHSREPMAGHHLEWFRHTLEQQITRRMEPWEHLRQNRSPLNTYLNRLTRRDYADILENDLRILENETMKPNFGEQFMRSQIRVALSQYGDDELFSNSVRFVLEPQQASKVD